MKKNIKFKSISGNITNNIKAFTIIELLIAIVILIVILTINSLVVVPAIKGMIEGTRKSSALRSAEEVLSVGKLYYSSDKLRFNEETGLLNFECKDNKCISTDLDYYSTTELDMDGKVGNGHIIASMDGNFAFELSMNGYCTYKYFGEDEIKVTKGDCSEIEIVGDVTRPTIVEGKYSPFISSDRITISYNITENESKSIDVTCRYGEKESSLDKISDEANDSQCTIRNIENGKTIYYEICATDEGKNVTKPCLTGKATTNVIKIPTVTLVNDPSTIQNKYFKQQVAKVRYSTEGVEQPQYFVYTSKDGFIKGTAQVCETIANSLGNTVLGRPGTCSGRTSTLEGGKWYKVNGNIDITYSGNYGAGYMYAVLYDGTNYAKSASVNLNKTEDKEPVLTFVDATSTTNSITIDFIAEDNQSGLNEDSFVCTIGGKKGIVSKISGSTYKCTSIELVTTKEQNYSISLTDNLGISSATLTGSVEPKPVSALTITWQGYDNNLSAIESMNGYAYEDRATVTYNDTNITSGEAVHYIKTTVDTKTTSNVVATVCGTGNLPSCSGNSSSISEFAANTWYKINTNTITVIFETEGNVIAYTYDASSNNNYASGTTRKIDKKAPVLTLTNTSSTTNSITVQFTAIDVGAGFDLNGFNCTIGEKVGTISKVSGDTYQCVVTGFTSIEPKKYSIILKDNLEIISNELTGSIAPKPVSVPKITWQGYNNGLSAIDAINGYVYEDRATITYNDTNITNGEAEHYIKTTVATTTTSNVTATNCGMGAVPSCKSNITGSTTFLAANTWYKIKEEKVTVRFTSEGSVTVYTYDASNNNNYANGTTRKIDKTPPVLALSSTSSTTNSITVQFTAEDEAVGFDLSGFSCTIGGKNGTVSLVSDSRYQCKAIGFTETIAQSYSITLKDKLGVVSSPLTEKVSPKPVLAPTISWQGYNNDGIVIDAINEYVYEDRATIAYNDANITSGQAEHYIKTTVASTTPSSVTAIACGMGATPLCVSDKAINTTSFEANTWYKITTNSITVIFTSKGQVQVYTYDASNNKGYASGASRKIARTGPTLESPSVSSTTNSITVQFTAKDETVGFDLNGFSCTIGEKIGTISLVKENTYQCTASGFKTTSIQNYNITLKDKLGTVSNKLNGNSSIKDVSVPKITWQGYNKDGKIINEVNNYVYEDRATVTYNDSYIKNGNAAHYIKTTVDTTTTSNVTATACGTGDLPSCSGDSSSISEFEAGTWYKIKEATVTLKFATEGNVIAYTYSANNNKGYALGTSRNIDKEAPILALSSVSSATNIIRVQFTATDAGSGFDLSGFNCTIGEKKGTVSKVSGDKYLCVAAGFKGITSNQTYNITLKDKLGTTSNILSGSITPKTISVPTITWKGYSYEYRYKIDSKNGYVYSDEATIVFDDTNINETSEHYIRTTVQSDTLSKSGTTSINAINCGKGSSPSCGDNKISNFGYLEANTWYKVTANSVVVMLLSEGSIETYTRDANGNELYTSGTSRNMDHTQPTLVKSNISTTTNSIAFDLTLSDYQSDGIKITTCVAGTSSNNLTTKIGTINGTTCTISDLLSDTTYYYNIVYTDAIGNSNNLSSSISTKKILEPDISWKAYNIFGKETSPINGYIYEERHVVTYNDTNISGTAEHYIKTTAATEVSRVTVTECGTGVSPSCSGTSYSTTNLAANTWYKINTNKIMVKYTKKTGTTYAYTYDSSKNYNYKSVGSYSIDRTGPTVTFKDKKVGSPTGNTYSGDWVNEDVYIYVTAADNGGKVDYLEWSYDGINWYSNNVIKSSTSGNTATFYKKISTEGINTIYYRAVDKLGNIGNPINYTVKIDKTAPMISFSPNGNSTEASSQSTKIMVSNTENGAGLDTSTYKYIWSTNPSAIPTTSFTSGGTYTQSSGSGTYYLVATACDLLGNCTTATSNAFRLTNNSKAQNETPSCPLPTCTLNYFKKRPSGDGLHASYTCTASGNTKIKMVKHMYSYSKNLDFNNYSFIKTTGLNTTSYTRTSEWYVGQEGEIPPRKGREHYFIYGAITDCGSEQIYITTYTASY